MIRAIVLTDIAYDPNAAKMFAQHSDIKTTTNHYVPDIFMRKMIKGLDLDDII